MISPNIAQNLGPFNIMLRVMVRKKFCHLTIIDLSQILSRILSLSSHGACRASLVGGLRGICGIYTWDTTQGSPPAMQPVSPSLQVADLLLILQQMLRSEFLGLPSRCLTKAMYWRTCPRVALSSRGSWPSAGPINPSSMALADITKC